MGGRTTTTKRDEESLERFHGGNDDNGGTHSPVAAAAAAAAPPPPLDPHHPPPRAILIAELLAHLSFLFGTSSFLIFAVYEFQHKARTPEARYAYVSAFCCNFLSGFIEFLIDVCKSQQCCTSRGTASAAAAAPAVAAVVVVVVRHGRYSAHAVCNLCISALFMTGTILDVVAFFLWDQFHFLQEGRVLYAGSHTWLLSAIIVVWAKPPRCNWNKFLDRMDDLGNILFFLGVVVDCLVRYLDEPTQRPQQESVHNLEFVSAPLWLCSASCYVLADVYRLLWK
jgi:hypothetical protein